jgi:hypothetical protein
METRNWWIGGRLALAQGAQTEHVDGGHSGLLMHLGAPERRGPAGGPPLPARVEVCAGQSRPAAVIFGQQRVRRRSFSPG